MPSLRLLVVNRRSKPDNIRKSHSDDVAIIDVTSKADEPWVRFSPFFPHGNIPVPFSDGVVASCVEGIWQALKVFESEDVDTSKLRVRTAVFGMSQHCSLSMSETRIATCTFLTD